MGWRGGEFWKEKSMILELTYWIVDRVTGAEIFCSEDAGEGEGVARGRGKGSEGSAEWGRSSYIGGSIT